jgi:hypothetical protein
MVLKLVKNAAGQYEYKDAMETVAPNITANEFEAYTGGTQTTLTGGTDLGTQTASLMRETPGQIETTIDPRTGEVKTEGGAQATEVQQQQFAPPSSAELIESPLERAAKIAQQFPMQQQTGASPQQFLGDIQAMQNKAIKAERINTLLRGGVDLGVSYLNLGRTGGAMNIQQTVTPLTSLTATPVGASTLGGVGLAGGIGYGVSRALGGDKKESTAAGAGAAIGTAVGGPVGGVVGGVIGRVIGGGTVICTELYKQNLMSKEDHRLSWNFTINNFSDTHINGYWYWAVPMVKLMKKNKLVTKFWNHIMSNRTKDIKWRLKKGKFNLLGRLYSMLIENGSYIVGKLIDKKYKEVLV